MGFDLDCLVIGAGVVGLAVARSMARAGFETLVVERHDEFGAETSSRNSEVIHAGLYYPQGSLKARLCVAGRHQLYAYCQQHHVPHSRCGKLVVATDAAEQQVLEEILQRARLNGVCDVSLIAPDEVEVMEPEVRCTGALYSPSTGIVDTHQLMLSILGEFEEAGGALVLKNRVTTIESLQPGFRVGIEDDDGGVETLTCTRLINSAGLMAPDLVRQIPGLSIYPPVVERYSRGNYFSLQGSRPFKHLIYPVPGDGVLGIHATIDLAGQTRFGPDSDWIDEINYAVDPARAETFYAAIRRYYPALQDGQLSPAYSGIRPKYFGPDQPSADFMIQGPTDHGVAGLTNLLGIESPGLTSCLAIADHVLEGYV